MNRSESLKIITYLANYINRILLLALLCREIYTKQFVYFPYGSAVFTRVICTAHALHKKNILHIGLLPVAAKLKIFRNIPSYKKVVIISMISNLASSPRCRRLKPNFSPYFKQSGAKVT
jgi:hypothetical protein